MTELSKEELQEIKEEIIMALEDMEHGILLKRVDSLISTIESQAEQIKEQAKEIERLNKDNLSFMSNCHAAMKELERHKSYISKTNYDSEKTAIENVQLRNQLREAENIITQTRRQLSWGDAETAVERVMPMLEDYNISRIQGKENEHE